MKQAVVVIDKWKLDIFKKHLDAAKRTYTQHPRHPTRHPDAQGGVRVGGRHQADH